MTGSLDFQQQTTKNNKIFNTDYNNNDDTAANDKLRKTEVYWKPHFNVSCENDSWLQAL